jgi:hypothetical protein
MQSSGSFLRMSRTFRMMAVLSGNGMACRAAVTAAAAIAPGTASFAVNFHQRPDQHGSKGQNADQRYCRWNIDEF